MRNISDKICREFDKTHFMFNNFFFRKSFRLWDHAEKYFRDRQATEEISTAHALRMLDN
jgi:hypothetical protein